MQPSDGIKRGEDFLSFCMKEKILSGTNIFNALNIPLFMIDQAGIGVWKVIMELSKG